LVRFYFSKIFFAGIIAVFVSLGLDAFNYARGLLGISVYTLIPIVLIVIGLGLIAYDFWRRMH